MILEVDIQYYHQSESRSDFFIIFLVSFLRKTGSLYSLGIKNTGYSLFGGATSDLLISEMQHYYCYCEFST